MKKFALSSSGKFLSGLLAGILLTGGVAYSATVNNTPEGGYLLCANLKTRAVTFPVKLSCPSGTKALEVAGVLSGGMPESVIEEPSDPVVASPSATATKNPSAKCNIDYLVQQNADINAGVAACTGSELNNLIKQINEVQNNPKLSVEEQKRAITVLTAVVTAIQKKVKG